MHEDEITSHETEAKPTGFYLGLDLGQSADFSAIIVNERTEGRVVTLRRKPWQVEPVEVGSRAIVQHRIRYIHRYALGTSYPDIVASVSRLLAQLPEMRDRPELWIDATGVGRAVLNIFTEAKLNPVGVAITAGAAAHRVSQWDVRIPKRELASLIQAVLQSGRIEIARDLAHSRTLEDELANFRVRLSAGGNETYEGRSGVHDDLVLSLAIAVWAAEKRDSGPGWAVLELARREMEAYHGANGGKPEPVRRTWAIGSVEYAAEQAEIARKIAEKGE